MWDETLILLNHSKTAAVIENLSSFFVRLCNTQNEEVSKTLAQMIKINLINPKNRHILKDVEALTGEQQEFLMMCYDSLFDPNNISSLTIRMQCLFHERFLKRELFKNRQMHEVAKKCDHLTKKLCNYTEDPKDFHRDLVRLILLKEGMADQNDPSAFQEMKTVVNSIFPPSALSTFIRSNQKTKRAFLEEISPTAAGIRLHNWYEKTAGKSMLDVGKIMEEILPQINENLCEELSTIDNEIKLLEASLIEEGKMNEKRCLIFLRNYYKFMNLIKESVQEVAANTYKLDYSFTVQLKGLDEALQDGSKAIYPSYKEIAKTWQNIQMEGRILSYYSLLYEELKIFASKFRDVESNTEISQFSFDIKCEAEEDIETLRIMPDDVKNFADITLEYQDLCAYHCSKGILVPCRRELGIIQRGSACYGFSTLEALEWFERDPLNCLNAVRQNVLAMPQLIITLGMDFGLPIKNVRRCVRPIFTSDCGVQTLLHPLEKNIVPGYHWNQWNLRRKALRTISLIDKKTHSTQTNLSHFRRENHSQVCIMKDQSNQTKRDSATNVTGSQLSTASSG